MDETFAINPATGTGSLSVPIPVSPGRGGFGPALTLRYDSGTGNGAFGLGWSLGLPAVARSTDRRLPVYGQGDVFVLAGAEDLVPELDGAGTPVVLDRPGHAPGHRIDRYRPRVEGAFARVERWTRHADGDVHWRTAGGDGTTTVYGETPQSRIADPAAPQRVFSWLICRRYDDRGNAMEFEYRGEDSLGVDTGAPAELNRTPAGRGAHRYLKRIRYGNRASRLADPQPAAPDWAFEVVLDYGDHDPQHPAPQPDRPWPARLDPFSDHRPGFDLRLYRLCRRVLMFHHFPDEPGVGADCLVRATELRYHGDPGRGQPIASLLASATVHAYRRSGTGYLRRSMPPVECEYSAATFAEDVREAGPDAPAGPAAWVDLDGEGISGALVESGGSWLYHRNYGDGRLAPAVAVAAQPVPRALGTPAGTRRQLLDLTGNGTLDVVSFDGPVPGFTERDGDGWGPFRAFERLPTDLDRADARLVDLDGDGHADLLLTDTDAITWYPSLGAAGFGDARRRPHPLDDETGPRLVLADRTGSVYLADMSGDGLPDVVRIRNGDISYWPNLGHGRFGARVPMAGAPILAPPESFDQRRVRLADVDGTGVADLLYLDGDGVRVWLNQSGNSFAAPHHITHVPPTATATDVTVTDLLGNGTACLVWPAPRHGTAGDRLRYLDLMGGVKPYLLVGVRNNLGAETRVGYASSIRFYLADRAAGRPWATRLPFPVHVVTEVQTLDQVSHSRFVARYTYHHGAYDGVEREFRGFGLVEQTDSETVAATAGTGTDVLTTPPVLTRTWFHTGLHDPGGATATQLRQEYWDGDPIVRLPATTLPEGLSDADRRDALRALRGTMLRQEVYAQDRTEREGLPYTVTERRPALRLVQPRGRNAHPVFLVHEHETVEAAYDRATYGTGDQAGDQTVPDPRVSHGVTLEVDSFGNVLRAVSVTYGRRHPDPDPTLSAADRAAQHRLYMTVVDNRMTTAVTGPVAYRTPLPAEGRRFELLDPPTQPGGLFTAEELRVAADGARRLLEHRRTLYRRDDLTGPLPLGALESLALPYESHTLALTPEMVTQAYGDRVDDAMLADAGYVHSADAGWWVPSGRVHFAAGGTPQAELALARAHFFLPVRFTDPFGATTIAGYDPYDLAVVDVRDALGNRTTVGERDAVGQIVAGGFDYRVLQPRLVTDANRNRSEVAFDVHGVVVGTAVRGKPGEPVGDSLDGFTADLPEDVLAGEVTDPAGLLGAATTRLIHDLFAYHRSRGDTQPQGPVVHTLVRETHAADQPAGEPVRIQHTVTYSDGFGRIVQTKAAAAPGPVADGGPIVSPRWIATGWTVFNAKGSPVREYEPFFTGTHRFEADRAAGVSATRCYDAVQRVVAVLRPDHSWDKVVFDPWRQETWDGNDTVLLDPRTDADLAGFAALLPAGDYLPTWYARRVDGGLGAEERDAAVKAAAHAATPTVTHLDSLGRAFRTRTEAGGAEPAELTRLTLDVEGNELEVRDGLDRLVLRTDRGFGGRLLRQAGMDTGVRRVLTDIAGQVLATWDDRGHRLRTTYDALRRPVEVHLLTGTEPERVIGRTVHGEMLPDAEDRNLRGAVHAVYDGAGRSTTERRDFKGNPLTATRRFTAGYREVPDWSADPPLETETYTTHTRYDALNRTVQQAGPYGGDRTDVVRPSYDISGRLTRLDVWTRRPVPAGLLDPGGADLHAITELDHDATGRRTRVVHGNGTVTTYTYDPDTGRLRRLLTRRAAEVLQDLRHTFDPVGNITAVRDAAQQTAFFAGQVVQPGADYTYDGLYRLVEAGGREQLAGAPGTGPDLPGPAIHPGDGAAVGRYTERYRYDPVGNLLELVHQSAQPGAGWTRRHTYTEHSNRLVATSVGSGPEQTYEHDAHGNMTRMPHLPLMAWDHADRLRAVARQVVTDGTPETTYYVYDAGGERVRAVTERSATGSSTPTRAAERRYLGGFEVHRSFGGDGSTVTLERESRHITDDRTRVALVETRTAGTDPGAAQLVRYQYSDQLGSATLELDSSARVISYEEYHPFGSCAYRAVRSQTETPKRYRYTGKERDAETGLSYHGARYYAPWLARWTAADPVRTSGSLYRYVRCNPIMFHDPDGRQERPNFWQVQADYWLGIGEGALHLGTGLAGAVRDPVTAGKALGSSARQAYDKEGVGGLTKMFNPFYQALVAGERFVNATDARQAGRDAFGVASNVLSGALLASGAARIAGVAGGGGAAGGSLPQLATAGGPALAPAGVQALALAPAGGAAPLAAGVMMMAGDGSSGPTPPGGDGPTKWSPTPSTGPREVTRPKGPNLRELAIKAGAEDYIDDTSTMQVVAHGTIDTAADEMVATQGGSLSAGGGAHSGKLFATRNLDIANIFAERSAQKVNDLNAAKPFSAAPPAKPAVVGIAIPKETADRLFNAYGHTAVTRTIDNPPPGVPPGTSEVVFPPDTFEMLRKNGFFFRF
ncbi:SpvB/TcaC N-terminal domain-containing protein [Dactylosporangium sp. NPDC049742]|uniref:SpvB/TcaC N-terminal domain-containing protein n=1 Tax=Dactylosporangium sp. NPDC049742 TaxID=3154737 RepID=UPI003434CA3B